MRFKDFKEAEPEDKTFSQELDNPTKKPGIMSKLKKSWERGKKIAKTGAGNKPDGTLAGLGKAIAGTAGEIKDLVKGDPKEKPKAEPKADKPITGTGPKVNNGPLNPVGRIPQGASFTMKKFGGKEIGYIWDNAVGLWQVAPSYQKANPDAKPLDAKTGIKAFNTAPSDKRQYVESKQLKEAEARIDHMEDLVFLQGSVGAKRAVAQLQRLAKGGHKDVTIKWDGSPAIIFGRDADGKLLLTDKSGFGAKGYDGKNKSPEAVEKMFLARPGAKDPARAEGFKKLAAAMKNAYTIFDKAIPQDYRGYFKGDMLYFNQPQKSGDVFTFKPNIVQYTVKVNSDIGKKIAASQVGVVIHREVDEEGNEHPLKDFGMFQGKTLFVIPPVTVSEAPEVDENSLAKLSSLINKNASSIDSFLDQNKLREMKVSDFPKILYAYVNSKVDTGLDNLGRDFLKWLSTSKVSRNKQEKIIQYVKENINTFSAIWDAVNGIMKVKNNIIGQLESQDSDVVASIGGQPGGEGYVLADPKGDIKFVDRRGFSAANRAVKR